MQPIVGAGDYWDWFLWLFITVSGDFPETLSKKRGVRQTDVLYYFCGFSGVMSKWTDSIQRITVEDVA